ncbi:MAG: tRNA (adenosine(37)-N6)-threonylcarbamoyltransferase complex dimerization subunit type 1 TsaB [Hyphomonadaceae bacterium]|nr:tRNA (adenosine(37)-N6)-threonylcarbamoyltransferase complex dimerization subunit type 1 TsaB [Hyphomonadaceae bacterium]
MLILGINTSGDACEAALLDDSAAIAELSELMSQGHDARLAPVVEQVMRMAGNTFADLKRIAVVVGPGSFTGLRTGVAFARGLSLALDIPAVGVTSLEALSALPQDSYVLGLLPAKRRPPERTWWGQLIDQGRGGAEPFEASEEDLASLASGVDAICGDLAGVPDFGPKRVIAGPTAKAAALFASRRAADDLPPPRPVYVREPDAKPMARP